MTIDMREIELPGGRVLDTYIGGAAEGLPLVMHHGTPSDSTTFADWDTDCLARGLRLICISRPGYSTSTRVPGRNVAHAAGDTDAVLQQLGHSEFLVAGWSGGGPHALACAAKLSDRCLGAATLAGVGPYGEPNLDFLAGMGPENVAEFGAAVVGEAELRAWMKKFAEPFRLVTAAEIAEAFGGLVPQIDRDVLNAGYADQMAAETRRALASGFDGWIDDDVAFTRQWGFDLAEIDTEVTVWQGDLDLMVPAAHGRWLSEHLRRGSYRPAVGHGHISLVTRYRGEILDELVAGTS